MRKTNLNWLLAFITIISFAFYGNAQNKNITGSNIVCNGFYIEGTTMDLSFTLDVVSSDYEYLDYVEITFPAGITPNSGTDISSVAANAVSGQVISWGIDQSSGLGPITEGSQYDFTVNVTVDAGLTGLQVADYYLAGDGYGGDPHTINSTFNIEEVPTCPKPTGLAASVPTSSDATLYWIPGNTETSWNIEWDTLGFTQGTGNILTSTDTFVNITGLIYDQVYEFYVQADCGTDSSIWAGPFEFKFLVGDNCSSIQDLATLTSPYNATTTDYTANDISGMACTAADNGSASRIFSIVINDGEELHIAQTSNTFDSRHSLSYGNSCPGDSLLACVDDPDTQEEVWTNNTGSTQTVYFIVAGYSSTSQGDFVLEWNVITCPDPSNLGISNLTNNSVDLSWDANNATVWDIEFDTAGFTPTGVPTFDDITTNPYNVTGLTSETNYEFYVREVCSATDTSNWVGPFSFTTTADCPIPTDLTVTNITSNTVDLGWNGYFATNWDIEFDTAGFTATGVPTYNDVTTNPYNVTGLLPETNYEFYVRADCGQNNIDTTIWIGPFSFTTDVSCPAPTALNAIDLTATSATLQWITGSSINWNIVYGVAGFNMTDSTPIAVLDTFYAVSGLTDGTTYEFYVQDSCGVGDVSLWTGPYSFTTDCGVVIPEYVQDFASFLPQCWEEAQGELAEPTTFTSTTSSNWTADGFANIGTTGSARINVYSTNRFEWLISKSIDLGTTNNYQLDFDLALTDYGNNAAPDTNGVDDKFIVVISTDNGVTWNLSNSLRTWDNSGSTFVYNDIAYNGEHVYIDLSSYTGIVKIGMYAESTVSNADNDLFIDNFRVRETPSCMEPFALNISDIMIDNATASWTPYGTESNWEIEYGTTGFAQGTGTTIAVTDTFSVINSLAGNTTYDFYVRAICGVGDESVWVGPYTFTTLCGVFTAPFTENFDADIVTPSCWDNSTNNDLVWDFGNATPSTATGPQNGDHTTGSGNFAFIETSSGSQDDSTYLSTPTINIDGLTIPTLEFYYNMYGATIGTLTAQIFDGTWNDIFTLSGEQDMDWHRALINLSAYSGDIQIRFIGIRGSDYTGDVSIDDVSVKEGPSCWFPTNLDAQNITNNSADLIWTTGGASTWNVLFGTAGFDTTGLGPLALDITTNPLTVDTLTAVTTYEYYVRDVCSATDTSEWVGPFQFTTLESCPTPTDLDVTNITTTSADLSWNGYFASNWDVEFGETGFTPTGIPSYNDVTNDTLSIDTLTTATSYDFYVRTDCGTDSSAWVGPYTFTTECDVITSFPYYEDFENTGNMPVCWSQEYDNGTHDWTYINGDNGSLSAYQGSYNAAFTHQSYGDITKLITPIFDLTSLTTPTIIFAHAQAVWAGDQDSLKLYYRGTSTDSWTLIPGAVWTDDMQAWTVESITLPNPTSTYQIAFEGIDQYGYGVVVDSVVVREAGDVDLAVTTPSNSMAYSSCVYTGQDTIPFAVTNNGDNIEPAGSIINAWYEYDGNAAVSETFVLAADLNPTETATFFFAQTVDFTGGNAHNVKVYIDYNSDVDATNDTTNSTFTMQDPTIVINQGDTIYVADTDFPMVLSVGNTFATYFWYNEDSTVTGTNVQLIINDYGTYVINATDTNGCIAADTIYVLMLTDISSIEDVNINVYPNPNNGEFTLNANFNSAIDFTVEMININGKTIYSKKFNGIKSLNENIDVDSYAKGIYYIRISNKSFVKQEKVVIY